MQSPALIAVCHFHHANLDAPKRLYKANPRVSGLLGISGLVHLFRRDATARCAAPGRLLQKGKGKSQAPVQILTMGRVRREQQEVNVDDRRKK